jgi:hypothetical protein
MVMMLPLVTLVLSFSYGDDVTTGVTGAQFSACNHVATQFGHVMILLLVLLVLSFR